MKYTLIIILFVFGINSICSGQKDTAYYRSWMEIHHTVRNNFAAKLEKKEKQIEQTAIVELHLINGTVDTFRIWSVYSRDTTNLIAELFKPLLGRTFKGYEKFNYVLVPTIISVSKKGKTKKPSGDEIMLKDFIDEYKNVSEGNITITSGLLLSDPPEMQKGNFFMRRY